MWVTRVSGRAGKTARKRSTTRPRPLQNCKLRVLPRRMRVDWDVFKHDRNERIVE